MKTTLLVLVVVLCGCTHMSFKQGAVDSPVTESKRLDFFILGVIPATPAPVAHLCSNGIDQLDFYSSGMDVLLGIVTVGLYTPRHVDIHCHPTNDRPR